jgi:hypothetical protein
MKMTATLLLKSRAPTAKMNEPREKDSRERSIDRRAHLEPARSRKTTPPHEAATATEGSHMIDSREFSAQDPLRPADWRYQAAADRVARGLPLPRSRWDSLTILAAVRLLRRTATAARAGGRRRPAGKLDALDIGLEIYLDRDRSLRYALEARVLADMPATKIAHLLGAPQLAIEIYESVFFDIRDRLRHRDFVIMKVINPRSDEPYDWRRSGWKLMGYLGRADALECVLSPKRAAGIEHVELAQRRALRASLLHWMRSSVERGDKLDHRLFRDIIRFVAEAGAGEEVTDYARNVEAMLMSVPLKILDRMDAHRMQKDNESGIELRASEQMLIAHGHTLPYIQELKDFRLRPPERRALRRLRDGEAAEPVDGSPPPASDQPPTKPELPFTDFP